ncbi:hypothetical protein HDV01_007137 [Terramyces sp. JEL0728]|nr:hypothetical protein HDV01_007137 [Terramyces sp. JEL0728]
MKTKEFLSPRRTRSGIPSLGSRKSTIGSTIDTAVDSPNDNVLDHSTAKDSATGEIPNSFGLTNLKRRPTVVQEASKKLKLDSENLLWLKFRDRPNAKFIVGVDKGDDVFDLIKWGLTNAFTTDLKPTDIACNIPNGSHRDDFPRAKFASADINETRLENNCLLSALQSTYDEPLLLRKIEDEAPRDKIVGFFLSESNENDGLYPYLYIAHKLQDHEAVKHVCDMLIEETGKPSFRIEESKDGFSAAELDIDIPFIFLGGSSGTGKTQTALAVRKRISKDRKAYYLLYKSPGENGQKIYLNYDEITKLFRRCIEKDLEELKFVNHSPSLHNVPNQSRFSYGFIYALLSTENESSTIHREKQSLAAEETMEKKSQMSNLMQREGGSLIKKLVAEEFQLLGKRGATVQIKKMSRNNVIKLMNDKGILNSRPVFILDEVLTSGDEAENRYLRLARNIFKSLGCGLVMLGTDSKFTHLHNNLEQSTSRDEVKLKPWCYVVADIPKVESGLLGLPENTLHWSKKVILNSRPLFATKAKKFLVDGKMDFDEAMGNMFQELCNSKNIFNVMLGQIGQVRLFRNAHCKLDAIDKEEVVKAMIHSHFAQLQPIRAEDRKNGITKEVKNFSIMYNGDITANGVTVSKLGSVFPNIKEDVLLYLTMMGGKKYSAFVSRSLEAEPYSYFYMKCIRSIDTSTFIDDRNAIVKSNDGQFLEAMLSTIVCLSSHRNGIEGIGFHDFIKDIVFQLQRKCTTIDKIQVKGLDKIQFDLVVPFLSPPNQKWPSYMHEIDGGNFANLERSLNMDRVDFQVMNTDSRVILAGESKDYGSKINLETMKAILKRIPTNLPLEIVFTRKLQGEYFLRTQKRFKDVYEIDSPHLLEKLYIKIAVTGPDVKVEFIKGLGKKTNSEEKIVAKSMIVFFEVDQGIRLL